MGEVSTHDGRYGNGAKSSSSAMGNQLMMPVTENLRNNNIRELTEIWIYKSEKGVKSACLWRRENLKNSAAVFQINLADILPISICICTYWFKNRNDNYFPLYS